MSSEFIKACRGEEVTRTPVWFMRQAGRSLPEYRRSREGMSLLETCKHPDLVAELTLQPVRRHGVDAAILFSDIMVPLAYSGFAVDIHPGVGPVIGEPVRSASQVSQMRPPDFSELAPVSEAARIAKGELAGVPLIGFAGGPFTLASYVIEGGPSRLHSATKALMYSDPVLWHKLCEVLAQTSLTFLRAQVEAGADAIQLFDSWAGALSEADYRTYVLPHARHIFGNFTEIAPSEPTNPRNFSEITGVESQPVPKIHFGVGTGHLLRAMADAGVDVIGVDWRTPLDEAAKLYGGSLSVQGNLDPTVALAPEHIVFSEVDRVVAEGAAAQGHIFNLGHGVLPETDPGILTAIVDRVHS